MGTVFMWIGAVGLTLILIRAVAGAADSEEPWEWCGHPGCDL